MVKSFLEFHTDVEADAGRTFLVLTKKDLALRQLLEFQTAMIAQNDIPGVIKMEVKVLDSDVKLCCHINGLISLANYLKRQRVSKSEFSGILDNIIGVLLGCGNYLLNDNSFILQEDFIYLHPRSKQISLVYVPVETESNAAQEFKSFLINLLLRTATIETKDNYVQILLNMIKSEPFSLVEFREQLKIITWNDCHQTNKETEGNGQSRDQSSFCSMQPSGNKNLADQTTLSGFEPGPAEAKKDDWRNSAALPDGGPAKPKVRKTVLGILAAVSVAGAVISSVPFRFRTLLTWPDKTTYSVYGLSLAVLLVVMAVLFLMKKNNALLTAGQIRSDETDGHTVKPWLLQGPLSSSAGNNAETSEVSVTGPAEHPPRPFNDEGGDETVFLDKTSKETSLLIDNDFPCLKPVNGEEMIVINKNDFKVGRLKEITDYVIPSKNIGRIHVEINFINDKYYITDKDSTNGTFINGSRLLSNKQYLLQNNDKVTLANLEYLFIRS